MSTETQTLIGKFVWHDHTSGDVEKAKSFYTELLGWEIEMFDGAGMDYPMIKANGAMHGGFGESQGGSPPHWLGHVAVEDADESAEKVKAAGGTIYYGPSDIPEVGRFFIFADPQGAVLSAFASSGPPQGPRAEGAFVWNELATSDVDGAKKFYGDVFGWTSRDMDMGGGMTYSIFEAPGGDAGGGMPLTEDMKKHGVPPNWLAYLGTDDVDAATEKAKELGATVHMEPTDIEGVGRFSVLQDPTGAAFALFKGAPES
jgi:predicted enzyme related to lactoylglutathione lyase